MADHRTLHVDIVANSASYRAAMKDSARETREFGRDADAAGRRTKALSDEIDSLSGRVGLLAKGLLTVGPALAPLSTAAVAGVSALGNQVAFAAAGAGVMTLAFVGMGDAISALNAYALEPTADNLRRVREELNSLAPEAAEFALELHAARDEILGLQQAAAAGFFPGASEGLDSALAMVPILEKLMFELGDIAGDITADSGAGLTSERAREFIEFLQGEARPAMTTAYDTAKHLAGGLAELWMAFDPLNDDIAGGIESAAARFDDWASSLRGSEDFEDFLRYVKETGPQVVETAGSLANAVVQIGQAAAPLGGPVLNGLEAVANTVALIADSPLGPAILTATSAMTALNMATRLFGSVAATSWVQAARGAQGYAAQIGAAKTGVKAAGFVGAYAAADAAGITPTYTALGAMAGSVIPGIGTAAGAAVGAVADLTVALNNADKAAEAFEDALTSGDAQQIQQALDAKRAQIEDYEEGIFGFKDLYDALAEGSPYRQEMLRDEARAEEALATSTEAEAQAAGYASGAQRDHAAALTDVASSLLAVYDAALGYEGALRNMRKEVGGVTGAFTTNGDIAHNLSQEQQEAAESLLAAGEAWAGLTANERKAAGGTKANRAEFVRTAVQLGMGKRAADRLANALFNIPPKTKASVDVQTADAMRRINAFKALYDQIQSKTVTITTQNAGYGSDVENLLLGPMGRAKPNAAGGIYDGTLRTFASGGIGAGGRYYDRVPQIVGGGANILWGEASTGWEAYISGKPSHRQRNIEILGHTASRLGYGIAKRGVDTPAKRFNLDLQKYGAEPASRRATVVHHHITEFPDKIRLNIGGRDFVATVDGIAEGAAKRVARSADSHGSAVDRMNWT